MVGEKLSTALAAGVRSPHIKERLPAVGLQPTGTTGRGAQQAPACGFAAVGAGGEGFRLHAGAVTPAQEEVELHLAYRWFCRLHLDGKVPHHSTFSVNRPSASITLASTAKLSPLTRPASMRARTTASNTCRNTSLSRKRPWPAAITVWRPEEADWSAPERQTRAVVEFFAGLDDEDPSADRKPPKVVSLSDPSSPWTAETNKRVQFG